MKLIRPEDRRRESPARRSKPWRGIPAAKWRYMELACGHITTPETQEAYRVFITEPGELFCEKCGTTTTGKPRVKPPPQPDDPPF